MAKKLVSTALAGMAGLLLSAGAALAQPDDHHDRGHDDHHGGPPPAAQHAPAPPAAANGHSFMNFGAQPAPAAPPAAGHRQRTDNRPSAGRQAAPAAQPAPRNAMRGPLPGSPAHGPAMGGAMRGPAPNHNNFASYHRNFNSPHRFRAPAYHQPRGWYSHHWTFGEILPALFWARDYWINDYVDFGLMPPPPGTVWVRDGSDALLIDQYDGSIIQVDYDVFY